MTPEKKESVEKFDVQSQLEGKPYSLPQLTVHGDVEKITKALGPPGPSNGCCPSPFS